MADQNNFASSGTVTPAANAINVTPADSDLDPDYFTRGVYVGGLGDLTVMMADDKGDSIVTFKSVPAGSILPIRVKQIRATLTTATLIVALF